MWVGLAIALFWFACLWSMRKTRIGEKYGLPPWLAKISLALTGAYCLIMLIRVVASLF
ncbi:MAG: hypothetical protein NTU41_06870 [Chloroflexi bacterium]|nr:hypothetical protein [Chloroflexota bacterium]